MALRKKLVSSHRQDVTLITAELDLVVRRSIGDADGELGNRNEWRVKLFLSEIRLAPRREAKSLVSIHRLRQDVVGGPRGAETVRLGEKK